MLYFDLLRHRNILIVAPDGALEKSDFERLASAVDPAIASNGKLTGLIVYVKQFPGWKTFGAFAAHLKFVANHHRQIERIAAVTSSGNLKAMTRIAGCFLKPQVKHFDFEQETQALAWLETGS